MRRMVKSAPGSGPAPSGTDPRTVVAGIIDDVRERGDTAVREHSERLDRWSPPDFRMTEQQIEDSLRQVDRQTLTIRPTWTPRDQDDLAAQIVADLTTGAGGTSIRSGVIGEIGLSHPRHREEEKVLRAACAAQKETGAALMIHPGRAPRSPAEALDLIIGEGVDPSRVIMSHVERTVFSAAEMRAIAATGCYVEFDLFGQESSYRICRVVLRPSGRT